MATRGINSIGKKRYTLSEKKYGSGKRKNRLLVTEKNYVTIDYLECELDNQSPPTPTFLNAVIDDGDVQVSWHFYPPIFDFDHYNLYRSTSSGFTPGPSNRIGGDILVTNYLDTNVEGGITYYYRVSMVDGSGNEGAPTGEVSIYIPELDVFPIALLTNI